MPAALPVRERAGTFRHKGQRLAYTEFGDGGRWIVLTPGLLIPAAMQWPLARRLAAFWATGARDVVRQEPGPSAALLQGLFFGHVAPHRDIRRTFTMPALIIGHHSDPVHPFSDAGMLAEEMPNARLLEASHIME